MPDMILLRNILPHFSQAKVLCVGDVMLDHFTYGRVERVSPEAPVPVFRTIRRHTTLGGAGNVVRNLASLGVGCTFISVVGDDSNAQKISDHLTDLPQVTAHMLVEKGRRTTVKTRFVAEGQQLLRADDEDTFVSSLQTQDALLKKVSASLKDVDMVIISDYGKGIINPTLTQQIITQAKALGKPVLVDPKGKDYSFYKGATLVTPNAKELNLVTSLPTQTDEEVEIASTYLMQTRGIEMILVTRGPKGMTLNQGSHGITHLPTHALEVYDVSGAGDTVVASLAAALCANASITAAAKLSNMAAGLVVAKAGTATITLDELSQALHLQSPSPSRDKIRTWQEANEHVIQWHRQGLRVGFTNGCFDLLHPGHISLLQEAKTACDRLIVALNSDASVKRLKGDSRPIQNQEARAKIMAALECADLVVIFDQDTPLDLISHVRPDVLIKGADYAIEDVVGAKEVLSWGGEVHLAQLQEGHSTTHSISKMVV